MKTYLKWKVRVIAALVVIAISISNLPLSAIAIFIESISGTPLSQPTKHVSATDESGNQMPDSVDQITLPTNNQNPYSP